MPRVINRTKGEVPLNSRKPIYAMLSAGLVIILALTFAPYALLSRARVAVETAIEPIPETAYLQNIGAPPHATQTQFDVSSWYAGRGEDPVKHAVLIESFNGQQVFATHNADITFNPASLIKLSTSLLALTRLGKDFRFETRVYLDGTIDAAGVLHGRLMLAGNDPTFGDMGAVKIAQELNRRGVKRVPDEIVASSEFSFNYSEKPEESARQTAKVMKFAPKKFSVGDAPQGTPLFVLRSYPLRQILLYMNAHSVNFIAEHLGTMLGGTEALRKFLVEELRLPSEQVTLATTSGLGHNAMTARGLLTVIRALNAEASRQGLKLDDIMAKATDDNGTLRRRMVGTPLEGVVVGKTGTLVHDDGGMASLGGAVLTQKNGMIFFVVLNQGSSVAESRAMTDELLVEIVMSQDVPSVVERTEQRRNLLDSSNLLIQEP